MLVLNTNMGAMNAMRMFNSTQAMQQTSMERMSSGTRINHATDDAAGLSLSDGITAQIRGLNQGVRNANDAISMAQTAEGSLGEIGDILQRMRELGVQASTGTYTDQNRTLMEKELDQLKLQIDETAFGAKFNQKSLLDGSLNQTFQVGDQSDNTIAVALTKSADSTNLPPVELPYPTVNGTISGFVNEAGDTMLFDIDGVSVSSDFKVSNSI
jgi:flagellin